MKIDMNLLPLFLAVAEEDNFALPRIASGVTARCQPGVRRLEDALERRSHPHHAFSSPDRSGGSVCARLCRRPLSDIGAALDRGTG